ncbi:LOW QUALITY PROTEIN: disease resistance protein RPV1-like [Arachis duranensis]|uniref:LOW QUALITY PROTEIN: disease resistance protein RPV1-like n=1 Tax=Arachis duranensis TaxID=130453 RepID=A0A9C6TL28_ARADU|nr:LOW QUALITY PROTEIN: disease resistance protein RPV1-like [Arachis duranensis]
MSLVVDDDKENSFLVHVEPFLPLDVFVSFRGEDIRTNFTSHLYSPLSRNGIKAYMDDEGLEKGRDVWPSLSQAIEDSHVAIVVFSKNYASSRWCLEELVKVLECRKKDGTVVIPVFYEVDPAEIRNQRGVYGEAIAEHERGLLGDKSVEEVKKIVSAWKDALMEAANISGRDTRSREYNFAVCAKFNNICHLVFDHSFARNESQVIDHIVEDVLKKLELRFPNELQVNLVGIDKSCKDVSLLLSKSKSKNVHVIGIWGMGGIGKTTVAKALQQTFIRRRLSNKKALVVLDDVDDSEQLEQLCRECSYAGPESKVIITTRNKHLLRGIVDEDDIYEVKTLSFGRSLELFCLSAFKDWVPKKGYEDLSQRAVDYAGGVPLALKVLGSNLRDTSIEFWDSELNKLKDYPYDGIQKVLRVSYDGLDILEQKIFLDIAFFFKDENKYFVEKILNASGLFAVSGIKVLTNKALITISKDKKIQMHDLIGDMGLNIVRQGIKDPGKRSRLKDIEEVSDVLEYKRKGSDAVEGIKLDLSQIDDLHLNSKAFSMMSDLRYLKLYAPSGKTLGNMVYPEVLNEFSGKLSYLEWHGYGLKSPPENLFTQRLVEICMPHSHITKLWHGVKVKDIFRKLNQCMLISLLYERLFLFMWQNLVSLERIDLSECKELANLPDLSKASKLKSLNLSGCESLAELHSSIWSLHALEILALDGCRKLTSLRSEKHLKSLKTISVNGCTSLREFSVSSRVMEFLDLRNAGIEELHQSIQRSSKLKSLYLDSLILIENLPNELSLLKNLSELRISNCRQLVLNKEQLHTLFNGLRCVHLLYLKDCDKLSELPNNIGCLEYLCDLRLDGSAVKTLPITVKDLINLEILSLRNCKNLKYLPTLPTLIKELYVINCESLVTEENLMP